MSNDRLLFARVLPWRAAIRVKDHTGALVTEWFPGPLSIDLTRTDTLLMLKHSAHGGRPVGELVEWRSDPLLGLGGVFEVSTGVLGDGVLDLVDAHRTVPCSPGFWPQLTTRHRADPAARERTSVHVFEVAVCSQAAYPQAHLRRFDGYLRDRPRARQRAGWLTLPDLPVAV